MVSVQCCIYGVLYGILYFVWSRLFFFQLLWVKENLQESWSMAFRWMDLSDWLSYRYFETCSAEFWTFSMSIHLSHWKNKFHWCFPSFILILVRFSRATGDDTRSLCTTVCKWTYLGHAHMQQVNEKDSRDMEACGWDDDFWEEIGLGDLVDGHHAKIGMLIDSVYIYTLAMG